MEDNPVFASAPDPDLIKMKGWDAFAAKLLLMRN